MMNWPDVHERAIEAFAAGWVSPGPHAWDGWITADTEFVQPLLRDGRGSELWAEEARRLLGLLPDLHAEVRRWAAREDHIFIDIEFFATLGGRPFTWRAIDELTTDTDGRLLRRESFFDATPLLLSVLRRPRAWPSWWRSGIAPLQIRHHLLRKAST